jgi:hypothetical protein
MYLLAARLVALGPFADLSFPLFDEEGQPRMVTVIHGGGGVGKTTLLNALATTRPGHAIVQPRPPLVRDGATNQAQESEEPPPFAVCDWALGQDDPERPHPLRVTGPNVRLSADAEKEAMRRREQSLFEKVAQNGGFAFLALASTRWFSRQPIGFSAPARSIARYDVRSPSTLDDASRSDLARETKQALAYAAIASALGVARGERRFDVLGVAMKTAVDALVELAGYVYDGVDPASFEPRFVDAGGRITTFDALPTRGRHLVSFAALAVRTLWAAYPGRDPRRVEGVIGVDEVDAHQDPVVQSRLVGALRRALPQVQWILTTTSPIVAGSCDTKDVLALRKLPDRDQVALFSGSEARTH